QQPCRDRPGGLADPEAGQPLRAFPARPGAPLRFRAVCLPMGVFWGPAGRRDRQRGSWCFPLRAQQCAPILGPMTPTTSLANNLLVAMPSLADGNFAQSVTLICEHSDKGALGIVLNKPLDMKLGDVLAQMKLDAAQVATAEQPVLR